jgi:hypothetical protein
MGHCISIYVINKSELRDDKINEVLSDYQNNSDNDSQLQAAIDYLTGN